MDKLPSEILTKIFGYLSPEELHTVSQVSMSWSRLTKSLGVCQIDFSSVARVKHSANIMIAKIKNEIPSGTDGDCIRHVLIYYHRLLPSTVFSFIQHLCPNVISFDYNYDLFDTHYFHPLLKQNFHPFLASPSWRNSIAHLPLCHDGRENLSDDTTLCERLESLTVHANSPFLQPLSKKNYYTLGRSLPYLPHLTSFTLHYPIAKFRETTINAISRCCPKVSILTLRKVSLACLFYRKSVVSVATPNVKNLNLENVTFLSPQTFHYLPMKFPSVQSLYILFSAINKKEVWRTYRRMYNMIAKFEHLTKLVVHVQDGKEDPDRTWFENQMQLYQNSHKHIHIDTRFV